MSEAVNRPATMTGPAHVNPWLLAYAGSALMVAAGAVLLLLLLRRQDVVAVGEGGPAAAPA